MTTTTKRNTPARTTRPMTAERWRESFADRIAFAGALLPDETDRERLGVWIAADALRLLCPVPRDPEHWLQFLGRYLTEQDDALAGVMRAIASRISEAIAEARARPPAQG
jgi:hypothetical protein